jgi:DNA excision repair protein ERCC-3
VSGPVTARAGDTLLLRVDHPGADAARADLAAFAELVSSPELVHTYRITDLGLWNARAAGLDAEAVVDRLVRHSSGPVPQRLLTRVADTMSRYGRLRLQDDLAEGLVLVADQPALLRRLAAEPAVAALLAEPVDDRTVRVAEGRRGPLKRALLGLGWPADDQADLIDGFPLQVALSPALSLRPYQRQAVDSWLPAGTGVVVLPCGAGKTVTAIAAAAAVGSHTLVLANSQAAVSQWRQELLRFTTLTPDQVGEYTGRAKTLAPVTLATYQLLATRRGGEYLHLDVMRRQEWGLVVYDEVHLLPSAVFRATADIQARRRLGLTATLVREDGREADVFSLVGPKRFDVPWRDLELAGWLAVARCTEVRVPLDAAERLAYARSDSRGRTRVAATASAKVDLTAALLARHPGEPALVIGSQIDGLEELARHLDAPLVTGRTAEGVRERLYDQLRRRQLPVLVVSKVANFALDLPEVSVAVQVSGTYGSRQEEAQRLGRLLRPKADGREAHFYTLVARETVEQTWAARRQRFLTEQGYAYDVVDAESQVALTTAPGAEADLRS